MPYYKYIRVCKDCHREYKLEKPHGSKYCISCQRDRKLITDKNFYPSTFYKNRLLVLKRDSHKCKNCKRDKEELHIHHIDTNKKNNSMSNLITLCEHCHLGLHGTYTNQELRLGDIFSLFKQMNEKKIKEKFIFLHKEKSIRSKPKTFIGKDTRKWELIFGKGGE